VLPAPALLAEAGPLTRAPQMSQKSVFAVSWPVWHLAM